jgi:hypothetical protein
MSAFDSNAFDPTAFDAGSFDLEAAPEGAVSGTAGIALTASGRVAATGRVAGTASVSFYATGTVTAAVSTQLGGTFLLALHGTGGVGPILERRPKAATSVKLLKITEGRAHLLSSRTLTTAGFVTADGYRPVVADQPAFPGDVRLLGCRSSVRSKPLRTGASATAKLLRCASTTTAGLSRAAGTATARTLRYTADTDSAYTTAFGEASSGVLSAQSQTTCERLVARGERNLSDYEIAAIVRVTIDNRR